MSYLNITSKNLRKVVRKLSLEESSGKRSKHPVFWYIVDGKKVLRITFPNEHGGSESVSPGFLNQIKNNFKLSSEDFMDLVDCPLSAEEYEEIIREKLGINK